VSHCPPTVATMKPLVGVGLLLSAFAPMVAIVALVRSSQLGWLVTGIVLVACLLSEVLLALVFRNVRKVQRRDLECKTVRRADERVLAFTSGYVVPVAVAAFSTASSAATLSALTCLVVLLGVIYVRGGLYHLNPTLALLGYRLYEITATNDSVTMLLTRGRHIKQDAVVSCRYIGSDVALELGG